MARIDNLTNFVTDIANAIREKKGITGNIPCSAFDTEIASIESGGGTANLQEKNVTVTANGTQTITPDTGFDGLSSVGVTIDVSPSGDNESFTAVIERTAVNPTLPSDLTSIGAYAFHSCTKLASPSLPNGITSIGTYAFSGCSSLVLTSLPSELQTINSYAFYNCTSLALTSLPSGLQTIISYAFYNCTSLALTSLPSGLITTNTSTFRGCTNLALTSLPSGLQTIGINAFQDCTSLALTSLPSGLKNIEGYGFKGCTGLTNLTFNSKPTISTTAFAGCTNLTTINVPWSEGEVAGAPWGATNATINYNYVG